MTVRQLEWAYGCLEVQSLGAMAGPIWFRSSEGGFFQPMQVAPWADEPGAAALPGLLRRLRGEWPCVPFGIARTLALEGAWSGLAPDLTEGPEEPHGAPSNRHWDWDEDGGEGALQLSFRPDSGPVRRITRVIRPDPQAAAVDFALEIAVERPCRLPLGLHPVFRIPDTGAVLSVPGQAGGMVFPAEVEPGVSRLAPGSGFSDLAAVPERAGGCVNLTRLPLPFATEELVQLRAPLGRAELYHPAERVTVMLDWQAEHFPGLVLWISNRGRQAWPWNGRHQALGLEPVASAFDLGTSISTGENPLQATGLATAIALSPEAPFRTRYRIALRG